MVPFGRLLEDALQRNGLSQSAFALQAGVPRSVVSEVISGRRKPPKDQADRWMRVLEVSSEEQLTWRRAAALGRADPILAAWITELEGEAARRLPGRLRRG